MCPPIGKAGLGHGPYFEHTGVGETCFATGVALEGSMPLEQQCSWIPPPYPPPSKGLCGEKGCLSSQGGWQAHCQGPLELSTDPGEAFWVTSSVLQRWSHPRHQAGDPIHSRQGCSHSNQSRSRERVACSLPGRVLTPKAGDMRVGS